MLWNHIYRSEIPLKFKLWADSIDYCHVSITINWALNLERLWNMKSLQHAISKVSIVESILLSQFISACFIWSKSNNEKQSRILFLSSMLIFAVNYTHRHSNFYTIFGIDFWLWQPALETYPHKNTQLFCHLGAELTRKSYLYLASYHE